ncbi:MAG: glycosyltransferase family 2 protein [Acidobacteriia bacterium]|nr:glycosyltransferase family 2 protein [Terriglobia bacterium]
MNERPHSISAFFPACNDVGSIGKIIHTMAWLLPKLTDDYEIVVVDDGSMDGTADLLHVLAREYPFLKVIHHGVNRGYGAALITGFANCSKDLIFYTDGDGQYDVEELPQLLNAFRDGVDVVNGYKISRSDPRHRILAGLIYRHLMRLLFRLNVRDVDCDFRLFRRSLLARTQLTCDSGVICIEMVKRFQDEGCRIVEVPVHHYHRSSGSSQFFRFRHLRRVFIQLFTAWWKLVVRRERLRSDPLRDLGAVIRDSGLPR